MGVRYPANGNNNITTVTVTTTTETVIATSNSINLSIDSAQVLICAFILYTPGTAATSVTFRLRRGSTVNDPIVNVVLALTCVANNRVDYSISYADTPGIVANQVYCITAQFGAATGNSTINDASIALIAL